MWASLAATIFFLLYFIGMELSLIRTGTIPINWQLFGVGKDTIKGLIIPASVFLHLGYYCYRGKWKELLLYGESFSARKRRYMRKLPVVIGIVGILWVITETLLA